MKESGYNSERIIKVSERSKSKSTVCKEQVIRGLKESVDPNLKLTMHFLNWFVNEDA
jgi:hypothetical protein